MLFPWQRNLLPRMLETICRYISTTSPRSKVVEKNRGCEVEYFFFLESNSMLSLSQFSYRRGQGTCVTLLTLSQHLQVALYRGMKGRFIQLYFSAPFGRISHCGLLYNLRYIVLEDSCCS